MQTNKQTEKPSALAGERAMQETAILTHRIRRQPASLANYHYHIEPGKRVYVLSRWHQGGSSFATVATMPEADCCSEDYFNVRGEWLESAAA
jgi:hypothetical protein